MPLIKVTFQRNAINFDSLNRSSCGHKDHSLHVLLSPIYLTLFPRWWHITYIILIKLVQWPGAIDLLAVMKSNHDHRRERPTYKTGIDSCCVNLLLLRKETRLSLSAPLERACPLDQLICWSVALLGIYLFADPHYLLIKFSQQWPLNNKMYPTPISLLCIASSAPGDVSRSGQSFPDQSLFYCVYKTTIIILSDLTIKI